MTNPFPAYADLELHNVAAALERGAHVAQDAQLCELRFVAESGKRLAVILTAPSALTPSALLQKWLPAKNR